MTPEEVAACLVTRGDVDMEPVLERLRPVFDEILVWDNTIGEDLGVYGRYQLIRQTDRPVIFVQDDDVLLPETSIREILAWYRPGFVTANMPGRFRAHYTDSCLVGFGAVFDRELPARAFSGFDHFEWFLRTCDVAFTTLTPTMFVDVEYEDREFASAPNRMWKQPGHVSERDKMLQTARALRDSRR